MSLTPFKTRTLGDKHREETEAQTVNKKNKKVETKKKKK